MMRNPNTNLDALRREAASIIDNGWNYSWHWGKAPAERHWTMDALQDCDKRIREAEQELVNLKRIYQKLEIEAPHHYPEAKE